MKFFQTFNKLCIKFEELPDIEFEKPLEREFSLKSTFVPISSTSPKLSYIISELKKRIRSSSNRSPITLNPSRLKVKSQTGEKVGPGTYKLNPTENSESHQFSKAPRLRTPLSHNLLKIESLYGNKDCNSNEIILKNKFLAKNTDHYKKKSFYTDGILKNKEESIKERKKLIDLNNKEQKMKKLSRKIQLFELRMMKKEIRVVQKAWVVFAAVCAAAFNLRIKGRTKKILKSRWAVFLRHFVVISRVIARIMKRLKNIRARILQRNLINLYYPVADYIKVCVLENKKTIQTVVIEYSDLPQISKLMVKVKFSVIKLQKNIRSTFIIKNARILALRILWEKLYLEYRNQNPEKSSAIDRIGAIQKHIIDKYTTRYISKTVRAYKFKLQSFTDEYKENHNTINNSHFNLHKPKFLLYTHKEDLFKLIEKAIKAKDSFQKQQRHRRYTIKPQSSYYSKSP